MSRPSLDPTLFDRADKARQAASSFLDRAKTILGRAPAAISDRTLEDIAQAEAKKAVDSGMGTIALTTNDLTPGMERVSTLLTEATPIWKVDFEKNKGQLDLVISDIEQEIEELQQRQIPALEIDKSTQLSAADHELETSTAYTHNREQYTVERGRFERLRTYNKGNYPRNVNRVLYWSVLFLIGVGDMIVNYNVLLSKFELAYAVIATLIIAYIVAVTSHVHGRYFKQRKFLFSHETDAADRKGKKKELAIVTVFFACCMVFIVWARYSYFAAGSGLDMSGLLSAQFIMSRIAPTLFFNLVVWFVGALIAFWAHERVPDLREVFLTWKRLDAELEEMRNALTDRKRAIERTFETEKNAAQARLAECKARTTALRATRTEMVDLDANYRSQMATQGVALMRRYAALLCAQIVKWEGDPSAVAFASPRRGRLSMLEFEATEFAFSV